MTNDQHRPPHLSAPPKALTVDGILDGRVSDSAALREAARRLCGCGAGDYRLEITGGRFNLLPSETYVDPTNFDEAAQSNFLDSLQAIVDASKPSSVETTLRCKLVYEGDVVETMFVVRDHVVEPISRRRSKSAQDFSDIPGLPEDATLGMRRKELFLVAPLLLIVGVIYAWQSGYIDRVLAARAETLETDTGPFDDMIQVDVQRSWGTYKVTLTRGAGYPATPAALRARKDASQTLTAQAACRVIGDGDEVFVHLLSEQGQVLAQSSASLRDLLTDPENAAAVSIDGHRSGAVMRLALSKAKKNAKQPK